VGENRPELFIPNQSGRIVPQVPQMPQIQAPQMPQMPQIRSGGSGGGGNVTAPVNIQIDARGADREGLARLEGQLARLKSEIPARVTMAVRDANKSNVKFR
jgi:hypothetical protein